MRWLALGGVHVHEMISTAGFITGRMEKYADLQMDLAHASLLWLTELARIDEVATLDGRDFGIYRTASGARLVNLLAD